jgi:hypothetical protein
MRASGTSGSRPSQYARLFARAVADFRDHGGHRHDPDRQDIAPHEVIQETALAGLEASQHGDADFVLAQRRTYALKQPGERGNPVPLRDAGGQVQGRWAGLRGLGGAVGFGMDILRPWNHSSSRVGAIIPEAASGRLMAGSITGGLNPIIASFRRRPPRRAA